MSAAARAIMNPMMTAITAPLITAHMIITPQAIIIMLLAIAGAIMIAGNIVVGAVATGIMTVAAGVITGAGMIEKPSAQ